MKILFLDIDGVMNCRTTAVRPDFSLGIDPYMVLLLDRIMQETGCKVVLSSSWRHMPDWRENLKAAGFPLEILDRTTLYSSCTKHGVAERDLCRGHNIEDWIDANPGIEKYAILDDCERMLPHQLPNFFKTDFEHGLTEEIARRVTEHLL